jgi:hypothetical protein
MEQMNRAYFDRQAKEFVLVTNGKCKLPHENTEAFKASHGPNGMGACEYEPHEGIALRVFVDEGKLSVAWTYRGIDWSQMSHDECPAETAMISDVLSRKLARRNSKETVRFIGRI